MQSICCTYYQKSVEGTALSKFCQRVSIITPRRDGKCIAGYDEIGDVAYNNSGTPIEIHKPCSKEDQEPIFEREKEQEAICVRQMSR